MIFMSSSEGQRGSVLVLAMMILAVLAAVIGGLSRDVALDLDVTRNLRLQKSAFNWAESGLETAEDVVGLAIDLREDVNGTTWSKTVGGETYSVSGSGDMAMSDGTVTFSRNGQVLSQVDVNYLGSETGDGNSIIIAAGYEGVGMGAGSGVSRQFIYYLTAQGNSTTGNGRYKMSEVYSHVAR